eukprot:24461_4
MVGLGGFCPCLAKLLQQLGLNLFYAVHHFQEPLHDCLIKSLKECDNLVDLCLELVLLFENFFDCSHVAAAVALFRCLDIVLS